MAEPTIDRLRKRAPWLLIGWSVFLWISRLRNVLNDDDLTSSGRAIRIGVVVIFVVLALVAAFGILRGSLRPLIVLIVWSFGYWLIRGTGILIGDWSAGFKAVHTVLMVVSMGLAGFAAGYVRSHSGDRSVAPSR